MNPYDVDRVAEMINTALTMDEDERRQRMKQLRCRESDNDVDQWMANFLSEMDITDCTVADLYRHHDHIRPPVKVSF